MLFFVKKIMLHSEVNSGLKQFIYIRISNSSSESITRCSSSSVKSTQTARNAHLAHNYTGMCSECSARTSGQLHSYVLSISYIS